MTDVKKTMTSGATWVMANQLVTQVLFVISNVILSRILSPREYGLVGMALVWVGFANIFRDFGMGAAVIQKKEITTNELSTAFWVNMGIGFLICLTLILASPYIAAFYHEAQVEQLIWVISVQFLLISLSMIQISLLEKHFQFKRAFFIKTSSQLVGTIVAIILALTGWGVWAIVMQNLTTSFLQFVILWTRASWYPAFVFEYKAFKSLSKFGVFWLGSNLVNYWSRNIDNILIGRFLGSVPLGNYSRAYNIMFLPMNQVVVTLARVFFPTFASIQQDIEMMKQLYLKSVHVIAFAIIPAMLGLWVSADNFILTVFGSKWVDAIPLFQILGILGAVQAVVAPVNNIFLAKGNSNIQFKLALFSGLLYSAGIIIGLFTGGVLGVSIGYLIAGVLASASIVVYSCKKIGMPLKTWWKNIEQIVLTSLLMAFTVWLLSNLFPDSLPAFVKFPLQVIVGATFYLLAAHLLKIPAYLFFKEFALKRLRK